MSMPQPIHVALVGSTSEVVRQAKKHFRLGAPGIGAACLVCLEAQAQSPIRRLDDVPNGFIDLWVALDRRAFRVSQARYRADAQQPKYDRGFYTDLLPAPCLLIDFERSPAAARKALAELAEQVIQAWYDSS